MERNGDRMLNRTQLEAARNAEVTSCDKSALADWNTVRLDTAKPTAERLEALCGFTRNPYLFRVGETVVKVEYSGERTLHDALARLLCTG